jgi:menaquinone-dependent protoporphyrinogen oxidase
MLSKFFNETKWAPTLVKPVAGALLYSQYNFLLRLVMRNISKKAGGDTDTSRDYDYTDWVALDKFVADFAAQIGGTGVAQTQGAGGLQAARPAKVGSRA